MRTLAIWGARKIPTPLKAWLHNHRALDRDARSLFAKLVGSDIVTIPEGPMKELKLIPGPHISHAHLRGVYESATLAAIDKFVQPGFVCYDLGASVGYLSLLMARKASVVYAFEPAPHAMQEIEKQAAVNGMTNIIGIPEAVSDTQCEVSFALTDVAYGSAIAKRQTNWPTIQVACTTLDTFAGKYPPPDFIKIDVEGEEARVLQGARNLLQHKRPIICCEVHSTDLARQVQDIMTGYGYHLTSLDGGPLTIGENIQAGDVQVMCIPQ